MFNKIALLLLPCILLSGCNSDVIKDAPPEGEQQAVILELASEEAQDSGLHVTDDSGANKD